MQLGGNIYPASYVPQKEEGGWLDKFDVPQAQGGYSTGDIASLPGVRKDIPLSKEQLAKNKKEVEERIKVKNAKTLADRKARLAGAEKANAKPYSSIKSFTQQLADETQATGDKFRLFPNDPNSVIDDYLNPGVFIGNLASGVGRVPLNIQQGNYGEAAWNIAAPAVAGATEALLEPVLKTVGKKALAKYVDVAEGNNPLNYAWRSPAKGLSQEQSTSMFSKLKNSSALSNEDRALIAEYQFSSEPFTGRRSGVIDQAKRARFDQIINQAGLSSQEPLVLSRRINLKEPSLYTENNYVPNRPLSFSAGTSSSMNPYSNSVDRMVMKLKDNKLKHILKNPYEELSPEVLQSLEPEARKFAGNIGNGALSEVEREVFTHPDFSFKQLGKVKNELGGYDYVVKPKFPEVPNFKLTRDYKQGGWLSKYEDGGSMQEHQENYNDSSVSMGPGFVGMGNNTKGRNYSPAWGGQFQDGGNLTFLEPTSRKLPKGYVIPYNTPSTELAMSIGGEGDEPAYLIPSFKYGKPLKDAVAEFRRTGEHLGGPFKTWQEADEWERTVRHPYVEKGQNIPTPIKRSGKDFAMGGSMPGSVGFTYARTQGIPSNGPYAKKTKASAQDGAKTPPVDEKNKKLYGAADEENVKNWFKDYYQSELFQKNLFDKGNAGIKDDSKNVGKAVAKHIDNLKYNYGYVNSLGYKEPTNYDRTNTLNMGDPNDYYNQSKSATFAHELGHVDQDDILSRQPRNIMLMLNRNKLTDRKDDAAALYKSLHTPIPQNYVTEKPIYPSMGDYRQGLLKDFSDEESRKSQTSAHDSTVPEIRSDIMALRYMAAKNKIWDASKSKVDSFTPGMLDQLYKVKELNTPQMKMDRYGPTYSQPSKESKKKGNLDKVGAPNDPGLILERLRSRYNDSDLLYLMNRVAKNENATPLDQAQNGAWLDKYDVPQAQDGEKVTLEDLLKVINKRAPSDATRVVAPQKDKRTRAEALDQRARANQPVIQTPKGKQLTREQVLAKNQQYAEEQGKVFDPNSGAVSNFLSPSTAKTFDRASENIVEPMFDIEMAMSAAPLLVGQELKTAGKFIAKETGKKNIIGNIINKSITPVGYDPFTVVAAPLELMTPKSLKFKPSTYATKNRFDSWRLYNGLEPEFNTFSKNPDGTLALNSFRLEKDQLQKIVNNPKKSFGTTEIEKEFNFGGVHGNGWITKGVDEQGKNFIDFTDTWDLQPLKSVKGLPKKVREFEVSSLTGGKPFDLKNRIYYDDTGNFYNSDGSKLIEEVHNFPAGVVKQNEPASLKMLSTPDIVGQKQMDVLRDWDKVTNSKFIKGAATLAGGVGSGIGYLINKEKQKLENTKSSKEKKEGGVIKDDRGQWAHPGEITEIQGNTMATHGYGDIPLWVEPNVGEPRLIQPNTGTHKFPGASKFKETPVSKKWLEKYK